MPRKWLRTQKKLIEDALVAHRNAIAEPMTTQDKHNPRSKMDDLLRDAMSMSNQLVDTNRYGAEQVIRDLADKIHSLESRHEAFEKVAGDMLKDLKSRLDLLTEAIAVSHMKDDDNKCIKDCLACHIIDVMKGLKAARKLMGDS